MGQADEVGDRLGGVVAEEGDLNVAAIGMQGRGRGLDRAHGDVAHGDVVCHPVRGYPLAGWPRSVRPRETSGA